MKDKRDLSRVDGLPKPDQQSELPRLADGLSERLKEIQERVEKATPGPWQVMDLREWVHDGKVCQDCGDIQSANGEHVVCHGHDYDDYGYTSVPDSQFIAHARTDIPWLVEQVQQLSILLRQQQEAMQPYVQHKWDCQLACEIGSEGWCPCHGERSLGVHLDCPKRHRCTCGLDTVVQRTAVSG